MSGFVTLTTAFFVSAVGTFQDHGSEPRRPEPRERWRPYIPIPQPKCFIGSTLISTPHGDVPIEGVRVGQKVFGYNKETNHFSEAEIVRVITGTTKYLICINIGNDHLKVSPQHRFFVSGKGWIRSKNIAIGDCIKTLWGTSIKVLDKRELKLRVYVRVYNIEVKNLKTYYVGSTKALVHNFK